MNITIPNKWRKALYVATVVLTPVVAYLNTKGYIGSTEVQAWSAEVAAVGAIAAFNAVDVVKETTETGKQIEAALAGEPTNDLLPKPEGSEGAEPTEALG